MFIDGEKRSNTELLPPNTLSSQVFPPVYGRVTSWLLPSVSEKYKVEEIFASNEPEIVGIPLNPIQEFPTGKEQDWGSQAQFNPNGRPEISLIASESTYTISPFTLNVSANKNWIDSIKYSFKNAVGINAWFSTISTSSEKLKPKSVASALGVQISLIAEPSNSEAYTTLVWLPIVSSSNKT